MSEAVHRINRQVFELTVADKAAAPRVQERVSRVHRHRLLRDLNDLFDRIDPGGAPVRLDRLTVDLGALPADHLEAELSAALRRRLPEVLSTALAGREDEARGPPAAPELELIERLLASGLLPWWADPARRGLLDAAVTKAEALHAPALVALLRRLLSEPAAAERAALGLRPRTLGRVVERLAPGRGAEARATVAGLVAGRATARRRGLRGALWAALLQTAAGGGQARLELWRDAIARLAESRGLAMREQLAALDDGAGMPAGARALLEALQAELPAARDAGPGALDAELHRLRARHPGGAGLADLLLEALRRRPAAGDALAPGVKALAGAAQLRALSALLARVRQLDLLPARALAPELSRWAERPGDLDAGALRGLARDLEQGRVEPARDPRERRAAAGTDGIPVTDAGLVILWPFIKAFFDRAGLLEDGGFAERGAQGRAIGLLHLAATGDAGPPEYRLALDKLLCGVAPTAPWPPVEAPDAGARAECDALLDAAIAHAPILRDMSRDGLRGTFLLRRGVLRAEVDGWLLRVERESYDVVLDRFPWPIGWVRLPWMPSALQVAW